MAVDCYLFRGLGLLRQVPCGRGLQYNVSRFGRDSAIIVSSGYQHVPVHAPIDTVRVLQNPEQLTVLLAVANQSHLMVQDFQTTGRQIVSVLDYKRRLENILTNSTYVVVSSYGRR